MSGDACRSDIPVFPGTGAAPMHRVRKGVVGVCMPWCVLSRFYWVRAHDCKALIYSMQQSDEFNLQYGELWKIMEVVCSTNRALAARYRYRLSHFLQLVAM